MGRIYRLFVIGALGAFIVSCGSSKRSSTTTISSSLNPAGVGQAVTFTALVSGQSGTPTGTVSFVVDGSQSMPVALTGVVSFRKLQKGHTVFGNFEFTAPDGKTFAANFEASWGNKPLPYIR